MAPARPSPEDEPLQTGSVSVPVLLLPGVMVHLEEDGTNNVLTAEKYTSDDDNDLTSLTWLQDTNLLEGMNLRAAISEAQKSPSIDYTDDDTHESTDSSCGSVSPETIPATVTTGLKKSPRPVPYDPLVHLNSKPPYSFSSLIFMAIEDSPRRALPVKEIYAWIQQHFPYFRNPRTGWKNSVRHTLSLNKGFTKVENAPNLGKGSLWVVEPRFRPNLLHSLKKAPLHSFSTRELEPVGASFVHVQNSGNLLMIHSNTILPNPDLFPFLSRRLAAVNSEKRAGKMEVNRNSFDNEGIATAMIPLAHSSHIQALHKDDRYKRLPSDAGLDLRSSTVQARASILRSEQMIPVIITSPSEDHTYSSRQPNTLSSLQLTSPSDVPITKSSEYGNRIVPALVYSSTGKNESSAKGSLKPVLPSEAEEHRKIVEGADALLNLAGISIRSFAHFNGPVEYPESRLPPATRSSTRGRRRGHGGGRSRPTSHLLHSVQTTPKRNSKLTSQRGNRKRKLQPSVDIGKLNKVVNVMSNAKFAKATKISHR